eukprot:6214615-Pleurochrysis_carterae.AAC.1
MVAAVGAGAQAMLLQTVLPLTLLAVASLGQGRFNCVQVALSPHFCQVCHEVTMLFVFTISRTCAPCRYIILHNLMVSASSISMQ